MHLLYMSLSAHSAHKYPATPNSTRRHVCRLATAATRNACQSQWDIVGFGQAMVDFSCAVDDSLLSQHQLARGERRVISLGQRQALLESLDAADYEITPGGSLANSLVAYSMLNDALLRCMPLAFTPAPVPTPSTPPAVAIAGPLGSDAMGQYFTQQMRSHGVHVLSEPPQHSSTGTVAVLTTPDAQRSFMSYLGSDEPLASHAPALQQHLPQTELLLIEGYLWEAVDGMQAIRNAAMEARAAGTRVALTCGDAGIVTRHASAIVSLLQEGLVDVLFANKQEALALLECGGVSDVCQVSGRIRSVPADACATALCTHLCPLVLVTDGANGAAIAQRAEHSHVPELHIVPPCWQKDPPADTNGAGDAFAGAFLFGWLGGIGVRRAGRLAARAAGAVITRPGAALTQHEAKRVVLESFGLCVLETDDRQLAAAAGGEAALGLGW